MQNLETVVVLFVITIITLKTLYIPVTDRSHPCSTFILFV